MDTNKRTDEKSTDMDDAVQGPGSWPLSLTKGSYDATVVDAQHQVRGQAQYDMVHVDFKVDGGKYAGMRDWKEYHLTTVKAKDFLTREFSQLGIPIKSRSEIPGACAKLVGKKVKIRVEVSSSGSRVVYMCDAGKPKKAGFDPDALWNS
jgi:hypothetical protein